MTNLTSTKKSSIAGKGLFADEDIAPGQCILTIARPLVAVLDTPFLDLHCSNCFSSNEEAYEPENGAFNLSACAGCKVVKYCSKKCQKESWKHHHKQECKVLSLTKGEKQSALRDWPNAVRAVIQLLAMHAADAMPQAQWEGILNLEAHFQDMKAAGGNRWATTQALGNGAAMYTQKAYPGAKLHAEIGPALFVRLFVNSLTLVSATFDPLGMVFDPYAASANHSCDPNAVIVMDGPSLSFRSIRNIKKDEEITISYIENTDPFSRRQDELKERYYFTCKCTKCSKRRATQEDAWLKPLDQLPQKWKDVADAEIRKDASILHPANYLGDDVDSKRMQALQALVEAPLLRETRSSNPKTAIAKLEASLNTCGQTGIWPLHRQPSPGIRHDLMVNLMQVGDLGEALKHAIKTYFLIDPVLYRYEHHPLRVAHKWMLTNLLLYMASGPEAAGVVNEMRNRSVSPAVIGWALLVEVSKSLEFSHGRASSFAKKVQGKLLEVATELAGGVSQKLREIDIEVKKEWDSFKQMSSWAEI